MRNEARTFDSVGIALRSQWVTVKRLMSMDSRQLNEQARARLEQHLGFALNDDVDDDGRRLIVELVEEGCRYVV